MMLAALSFELADVLLICAITLLLGGLVLALIKRQWWLARPLGVLAALLSALLGGKLWGRGNKEEEKPEPQGLEEETGPGLVTEVKPPLRPTPTPTKDLSEVIDDAPPTADVRTDGHLSDTPGDHDGVPPGSEWWNTSND